MKLIDINKENWKEVILLTTDKDGKHPLGEEYVASNAYSIAQSIYEDGWVIKAIEHDEKIIGFTMYGFSEEDNFYEICRFMIEYNRNKNGWECRSITFWIQEINTIYLFVVPENLRAKHVYEEVGFVSTGKIIDEEELYMLHSRWPVNKYWKD